MPPIERISSASAYATRVKSMTPVVGLQSAWTPLACGSNSAIRSRPTFSRPGTWLASARSRSASSRGTSDSSRAMTSLPQKLTGMPWPAANSSSSALPARQRRALSEPGG